MNKLTPCTTCGVPTAQREVLMVLPCVNKKFCPEPLHFVQDMQCTTCYVTAGGFILDTSKPSFDFMVVSEYDHIKDDYTGLQDTSTSGDGPKLPFWHKGQND